MEVRPSLTSLACFLNVIQGLNQLGKTNGRPGGIPMVIWDFCSRDIIIHEDSQFLLNKDILFLCLILPGAQRLVKERQACFMFSVSMLIYVQQNSQMRSPEIGEANRSSTCKKDGNMRWTCILRQVESHKF